MKIVYFISLGMFLLSFIAWLFVVAKIVKNKFKRIDLVPIMLIFNVLMTVSSTLMRIFQIK